jgi:hypothetical protein
MFRADDGDLPYAVSRCRRFVRHAILPLTVAWLARRV